MSTATTGMPGVVDRGEHLGRGGSQRPGAGDADDAVDHQIGCGRDGFAPPGRRPCGTPPAPWRGCVPGLSSTAVGGRTAAAQERRRPQRVTAVVAGADDRADLTAGDAARCGPQFARRSRWPGRRRPDASAHRRAGSPAAVPRRRGSRRRCSSAASAARIPCRRAFVSPTAESGYSTVTDLARLRGLSTS